ncbi:PEP-CTERM sorting domain-containing protein [Aquabacterium sp.]|uniref:PEP-CTERM sorting domain-containing protein n=1 Tax=Aquabacterium sp. TaxID=1872578 RepID=UPI003D6D9E77
MRIIQTLLSTALMAGAATQAQADLAYTFDQDAQGFTVNEPAGVLSHQSAGYLRVQDLTGDTNVSLLLPGSALTGGWLPYLGGTLSFDARLESAIDAYWPEFGTITLFSTLGSVAVDVAAGDAPGLGWATYSVTLDAASWNTTPEILSTVLANLQQVDISLEAGNGPIEILHIDNVRLSSAVPEPTSWAMTGIGLLALGWARRRRSAA